MAMYGEFFHRVDDKGRVILPAAMRDTLGDKFVIVKSTDSTLKILYLYTKDDWDRIMQSAAEAASLDRSQSLYVRQLSAAAKDTELDAQNRVLIPIEWRSFASIEKEAVLLGLGNKVEIWNSTQYKNYMPSTDEMDDEQMQMHVENTQSFHQKIRF